MEDRELNLATLVSVFTTEESAIGFLETKRQPNGTICLFCGSDKIYSLKAKIESTSPVRRGVHQCAECHKQFIFRKDISTGIAMSSRSGGIMGKLAMEKE